MMLTAFVLMQIVFDVAVLALLGLYVLGRRAERQAARPPDWYEQFVGLAQAVLAATEPVLDRLEERGAPPEETSTSPSDRYRQARALLRAGMRADEAAGRAGLSPGEMRLLTNVVAAEGRAGTAPAPADGGA